MAIYSYSVSWPLHVFVLWMTIQNCQASRLVLNIKTASKRDDRGVHQEQEGIIAPIGFGSSQSTVQ